MYIYVYIILNASTLDGDVLATVEAEFYLLVVLQMYTAAVIYIIYTHLYPPTGGIQKRYRTGVGDEPRTASSIGVGAGLKRLLHCILYVHDCSPLQPLPR